MADIFRTTAKKRDEAAEGAPSPSPPKPAPKPPVDFIRGFTPEERMEQARKGADFMREIAERDKKRGLK